MGRLRPMSKATADFGETLHDWRADPRQWQAGALFQPRGLGQAFPQRSMRRGSRWGVAVLVVIAAGAGAVAVGALARLLSL